MSVYVVTLKVYRPETIVVIADSSKQARKYIETAEDWKEWYMSIGCLPEDVDFKIAGIKEVVRPSDIPEDWLEREDPNSGFNYVPYAWGRPEWDDQTALDELARLAVWKKLGLKWPGLHDMPDAEYKDALDAIEAEKKTMLASLGDESAILPAGTTMPPST